jgi:hypothetical protein
MKFEFGAVVVVEIAAVSKTAAFDDIPDQQKWLERNGRLDNDAKSRLCGDSLNCGDYLLISEFSEIEIAKRVAILQLNAEYIEKNAEYIENKLAKRLMGMIEEK